jgi:hypothetical protein
MEVGPAKRIGTVAFTDAKVADLAGICDYVLMAAAKKAARIQGFTT